MKVVLDARKLGDGGIGIYIQNLVDGFVELIEEGVDLELTLFVAPDRLEQLNLLAPSQSFPDAPLNEAVNSGAYELAQRMRRWEQFVRFVPEASGKYSFSEYLLLARRHRKLLQESDLFHSPHYTLPFGLGIPSVITVHDVIHVTQPETFRHAPIARRLIRSGVKRAAHVITVSGASLARLTRVVGCPSSPVTVVPNALRDGLVEYNSEEIARELIRLGRSRPYALFVGSDRPHKNFQALVESWKLLNGRLDEDGLELVELVAVGSRYSHATQEYVNSLSLNEHVSFLGEVSDADLNVLYRGAHAVVVPSIEEGFGLVALEGLFAGTPVVCTPEVSLKEVCDGCAWYAEDASAESLAHAVYSALTESELAEARSLEGIERARLFSRELVARMTLAVYEDVLAGGVLDESFDDYPALDTSGGRAEIYAEHLRRAV